MEIQVKINGEWVDCKCEATLPVETDQNNNWDGEIIDVVKMNPEDWKTESVKICLNDKN